MVLPTSRIRLDALMACRCDVTGGHFPAASFTAGATRVGPWLFRTSRDVFRCPKRSEPAGAVAEMRCLLAFEAVSGCGTHLRTVVTAPRPTSPASHFFWQAGNSGRLKSWLRPPVFGPIKKPRGKVEMESIRMFGCSIEDLMGYRPVAVWSRAGCRHTDGVRWRNKRRAILTDYPETPANPTNRHKAVPLWQCEVGQ